MAWGGVFVFGKDALISDNGANALTVFAGAVVQVGVARDEVEVVGDTTVVFWELQYRRPIAAELTNVVELATQADASSGQEYAISVNLTGELHTFHAIERSPFISAVVK